MNRTEAWMRSRSDPSGPDSDPAQTVDLDPAAVAQARYESLHPALRKSVLTSVLSITIFSLFLFPQDPTGMGSWLVLRAGGMVLCLVVLGRIARSNDPPRNRLRALAVLFAVSGTIWGLLPLLVSLSEPQWLAVVVLWIFGNQAVMTTVCSPDRTVFIAAVGSVTVVGAATIAITGGRFGLVLMVIVLLGGAYSVSIFSAVHGAVNAAISGRLVAQGLASSLQAKHTELTDAIAALADLAHRDSLTGLPNRRALASSLTDDDGLVNVEGWLGIIDLDRFKQINDSFGHAVGDDVLVAAADRWRVALADDAILGRTGGDEFLFFIPSDPCENGELLGRTLVDALGDPVGVGTEAISIGCSIGMAYVSGGRLLADGMKRADDALYAAKATDHDRVVVAASLDLSPSRQF